MHSALQLCRLFRDGRAACSSTSARLSEASRLRPIGLARAGVVRAQVARNLRKFSTGRQRTELAGYLGAARALCLPLSSDPERREHAHDAHERREVHCVRPSGGESSGADGQPRPRACGCSSRLDRSARRLEHCAERPHAGPQAGHSSGWWAANRRDHLRPVHADRYRADLSRRGADAPLQVRRRARMAQRQSANVGARQRRGWGGRVMGRCPAASRRALSHLRLHLAQALWRRRRPLARQGFRSGGLRSEPLRWRPVRRRSGVYGRAWGG